jgi:hypothetical protein
MSSVPRMALFHFAYSFAACGLLFTVSFAGCGSGEPFSYVPASGSVKYDDGSRIPADDLQLTFIAQSSPNPADEKNVPKPGNAHATGTEGKFESVSSHNPDDGLLPVKYKVVIHAFDGKGAALGGVIPPEYEDSAKTPVEVDANIQPIEIKVKKPAGGVKPTVGPSRHR